MILALITTILIIITKLNLIDIAQFDTIGILTAQYIVINYIQTQDMHINYGHT